MKMKNGKAIDTVQVPTSSQACLREPSAALDRRKDFQLLFSLAAANSACMSIDPCHRLALSPSPPWPSIGRAPRPRAMFQSNSPSQPTLLVTLRYSSAVLHRIATLRPHLLRLGLPVFAWHMSSQINCSCGQEDPESAASLTNALPLFAAAEIHPRIASYISAFPYPSSTVLEPL